MKLAGRPFGAAGTLALLALVVVLALLAPTASASEAPKLDTVVVPSGSFFQETILLPVDGSPWTGSVRAVNGSGPVDLYIIRTIDTIGNYPSGGFVPIDAAENSTFAVLTFAPSDRITSYTAIIDNLDNARPTDARPSGEAHVEFRRSPPLQASTRAQALLSGGLQICAVLLGVLAVALALFLRRKRARNPGRVFDIGVPPSVEIPVEVPAPQRGAWAKAAEPEPQGGLPEPPSGEAAAPEAPP